MKFSILFSTLSLTQSSIAGYVLQDEYNPSNFLDSFKTFSGPDPTEGFVKLVDMDTGKSTGLITTTPNSVKLGVDTTNITPNGRPSVRLESKKTYDSGLIIADLAHMPGSICGTWPAFWSIGPDWPSNGEIDIIEGVNSQSINAMTLHTSPGCSISNAGQFNGLVKTSNCDTNAPGQGKNVGCGITAKGANTYGDSFNGVGGGVYATDWTQQYIAIYHFERSAIPADIVAGRPDPAAWGEPLALFAGSCDITTAIKNQTIIFDTTFCGQWAGQQAVWQADPVCSKKAATCQDYVQNNPADFKQTYWEINSVKVYRQDSAAAPPGSPSAPSGTKPAIPSASSSMTTSVIPAAPTAPSSPRMSTMTGPNYTSMGIVPTEVSGAKPILNEALAPSQPTDKPRTARRSTTPQWSRVRRQQLAHHI